MTLLMKESPYNLFKSLEGIYLLDKADVGYGKDLLDDLIVPIDKLKYNRLIYDKNKDNDFYMKIGDNHKVVNKYRKEETNIWVKNSHILLKTNIINKTQFCLTEREIEILKQITEGKTNFEIAKNMNFEEFFGG